MTFDAPAGAGADLRAWRKVAVPGPECSYDNGQMTILFDTSSGETHFLGELPVLVLGCLSDEFLPFEQLIDALSGDSSSGLNSESLTAIAASLDFLEGAELVESQAL